MLQHRVFNCMIWYNVVMAALYCINRYNPIIINVIIQQYTNFKIYLLDFNIFLKIST